MKKTVPQYLVELYGATQSQWEAWLGFLDAAKRAFASRAGVLAWFGPLHQTGSAHRCGLHSSSSAVYARPFPWATASKTSSDYFGVHYSLSYEMADCDEKTLCEMSWD